MSSSNNSFFLKKTKSFILGEFTIYTKCTISKCDISDKYNANREIREDTQ